MMSLNRWLDALPRTAVWRGVRPVPVFRTAGVAGFYAAVAVLMAAGLLRGLSPLVLVAVATVAGLSFFAFAFPRKWIAGREDIVLLEHVWFALGCTVGGLWLAGKPVLPYLDVFCVALPVFLACGRVGCFLVGCCHGRPASVGVCYGDEHARDGFPQWLAGVRLFPVQLVESAGLLAIAAVGALALAVAAPGRAFEWFLVGYAVMRFGLEQIRGDARPHVLGLSQSQWMGIAEVGLVVGIELGSLEALRDPVNVALAALPLAVLVLALALGARAARARRLDDATNVAELRELVIEALAAPDTEEEPTVAQTSRGLLVGVTPAAEAPGHVSISDPRAHGLEQLCRAVGRALPEAHRGTAFVSRRGVLHVDVQPVPSRRAKPDRDGLALWASVLRRMAEPERGPEDAEQEARPPSEDETASRASYFRKAV